MGHKKQMPLFNHNLICERKRVHVHSGIDRDSPTTSLTAAASLPAADVRTDVTTQPLISSASSPAGGEGAASVDESSDRPTGGISHSTESTALSLTPEMQDQIVRNRARAAEIRQRRQEQQMSAGSESSSAPGAEGPLPSTATDAVCVICREPICRDEEVSLSELYPVFL